MADAYPAQDRTWGNPWRFDSSREQSALHLVYLHRIFGVAIREAPIQGGDEAARHLTAKPLAAIKTRF